MIEVLQTKFGGEGNCFAACVASILECDIETVDYQINEEDWFRDYCNKLGRYRALSLVGCRWRLDAAPGASSDCYVIATGENNKRTDRHSCVCSLSKNKKESILTIEHDPMGHKCLDIDDIDTVFFIVSDIAGKIT